MPLTKNESIFILNYYNMDIPIDINTYTIKNVADNLIDSKLCKPIIGKNLKSASISKKISRNRKKKYN